MQLVIANMGVIADQLPPNRPLLNTRSWPKAPKGQRAETDLMFGSVLDLLALHAPEVFRIVGNDKRSHRPRSDHNVSGPELSPTVLQVCPGIGVMLGRLLWPIQNRQVSREAA